MTCIRIVGAASTVGGILDKYKKIDCKRTRMIICVIAVAILLGVIIYYIIKHTAKENDFMDRLRGEQFKQIEGFAMVRAGSNSYKVHEDLDNPQGAAQTMEKLNITATQLIDHLYTKYIDGEGLVLIDPKHQKTVREGIKALKKNFRVANMEENIPERSGGDTSYVIDKGDVFAMCLRDPKNNNKLDDKYNNLVFVLLHELTHLFTSSFGHDTLFWNNFRFVLQEAVSINIYTPIDYKRTGSPYCGIVVTYSPLYDMSLKNYFKRAGI